MTTTFTVNPSILKVKKSAGGHTMEHHIPITFEHYGYTFEEIEMMTEEEQQKVMGEIWAEIEGERT